MFKLRAATSIGGVAGGSELECLKNWVGTPDKGKILGVRPTGQGWRLFWGYNDPPRLSAWLCQLCASYILSVCGLSMPRAGRSFISTLNAAFVLELRLLRVPKD